MAELTLDSILNLIYLVSVEVFMGYGPRIQAFVMLVNVRRKLGRLESFRDSSYRRLLDLTVRHDSDRAGAEKLLDRLTMLSLIGLRSTSS